MTFNLLFATYINWTYLDKTNIVKFNFLTINEFYVNGENFVTSFSHNNLNHINISELLINRNLREYFINKQNIFYNIYDFRTPNNTYDIGDKTFFSTNSVLFRFEV